MFLFFLQDRANQDVLSGWHFQKARYVDATSLIVREGQRGFLAVSHHHDGAPPMNFKAP